MSGSVRSSRTRKDVEKTAKNIVARSLLRSQSSEVSNWHMESENCDWMRRVKSDDQVPQFLSSFKKSIRKRTTRVSQESMPQKHLHTFSILHSPDLANLLSAYIHHPHRVRPQRSAPTPLAITCYVSQSHALPPLSTPCHSCSILSIAFSITIFASPDSVALV